MVNRIQKILDTYNLTAAKLADQLDIPRSTISHILSERNKPSLDFIQKVLSNFPEINARWLVKGEGKIFDEDSNLFYANKPGGDKKDNKNRDDTPSFPGENSIKLDAPKEEKFYPKPGGVQNEENSGKALGYEIDTDQKNTLPKQGKVIIKLIAIYNDATFSEFIPSSDK